MKKRYFPLLLIFALCMYGCAVQQTDSPAKTPAPDTDICENVTEESISTEAEGSVWDYRYGANRFIFLFCHRRSLCLCPDSFCGISVHFNYGQNRCFSEDQ